MKRSRIEQIKRAMEVKRRSGDTAASSGHITRSFKGAPSLRVARDRAHEAMEKQMSKAGTNYTPHMEKQLLRGVEQAFYNRDFHREERDKRGN